MVTGRSPMMRNRSWKSLRWNGSSLANAARRPASSGAMIIWRTALMRSGSKNMCSVRQRPMPSAPYFFAVSASSGVSAFARTFMRRDLSAHSISVAKSVDMAASIIATWPTNTSPVVPSRVMVSPARTVLAAGGQRLGVVVDRNPAGARDAGPAHAARHHGGVAGHPAARGQDAAGGVHAVDVLGAGLDAHQDDRLALLRAALRLVGGEHRRARCGARAGRQALRQQRARRLGIERRMQQLVERGRVDPPHRLGLVDQPLTRHVHRDAQARRGGAFAVAGLQHVQLALLHGELEVLHVAVVLLELLAHLHQLGVGLGHRHFQRRSRRAWRAALDSGCGVRMPATTSSPCAFTRYSP